MTNLLINILLILSTPLIIINIFAGIISLIWLALLGEWATIGRGIGFLLGGALFIQFIGFIFIPIIFPLLIVIEKTKSLVLKTITMLIPLLFTFTLMIAWCYLCMFIFLTNATSTSMLPLLLWTYGIVIAPFCALAQRDELAGGNIYSTISTFFYRIGFIINIIAIKFFDFSIKETFPIFISVMILTIIIEYIIALSLEEEHRHNYINDDLL